MQTSTLRSAARSGATAALVIAIGCVAADIAAPAAGMAAQTASRRIGSRPRALYADKVGGALLAQRGVVVRDPRHKIGPPPKVPASAYVIADADSGAVLAAKSAHGLFPPASTLKVLTAVTMLPRLNPNATVLATKRAASVEPNIVGLIPGHRYKVCDLFRALLLISANDAAVALVQASGSFAKGMALVNDEAYHLQAYDVTAKQPNGLPAPGQVVSAYDLALIARKALSMPAFMRYDSRLAAKFPVSRHKRVTLVNQNYLLTKYRGGIGGKIGWTLKAGATYIGLARRHGETLIVTILHATPLTEITSAERLLSWGFAANGRVSPVGVLVPPLATARQAAARQASRPVGAGGALPGTRAKPASSTVTLGAGVAAGLCAVVLAVVAWLRRRGPRGRRTTGG
jgi:serine-type D-Ala-D-Ala carboxypeptidase (penicillin-binding protein 5/6)